jgi:tRNA dihydrouridine synthase A
MNWFEKIKKPIIGLAPMHQVTNSAMRLKCRRAGADVVYTEMIASEAIIRDIPQAKEMASFAKEERPVVIQIFGSDPIVMAQAAKKLEDELGPDGIDINFGCPVQKAAKQGFGACQLFEPDKAAEIGKAIKKALKNTPLSAKLRLATKDVDDTIRFIDTIQKVGIDLISIHGRSATQKYRGEADWKSMHEIKNRFPDLVILGNGDIKSQDDIKDKIGNLDGVLIGRAAKLNPEIFGDLSKIKND